MEISREGKESGVTTKLELEKQRGERFSFGSFSSGALHVSLWLNYGCHSLSTITTSFYRINREKNEKG